MDGFVIELDAVLDRGDAGIDAVVQSGTIIGVAGDLETLQAGFIDDGLDLFKTEIRDTQNLAVGQEAIAVVSIHFDQVGAVVELFTHGFARFVRTVDELHAAGNLHLRCVAFELIAAGG